MAGSGAAHLRPAGESYLAVRNLVVEYRTGRRERVHAVSDVSIDVRRGETLGLVGESGCGKSTVAKAIMQLPPPNSGRVELDGVDLVRLDRRSLRRTRDRLQMIFQDPISSLNPLRRVREIVAEGLVIRGGVPAAEIARRVDAMLDLVGLDPASAGERRPHEFSGGQCQRISIARAMVLDPDLVICDEPVSALDVSVQAQILNLLEDMKARYDLTLLFIAHDLAVVKNVSDRVVVMYLGKICEVGPPDALFAQPLHPYTEGLLASVPEPDPDLPVSSRGLDGDLPSPLDPPSGCRFRTRCPRAAARCAEQEPQIRELRPDHFAACHFPDVEGPLVEGSAGVGAAGVSAG